MPEGAAVGGRVVAGPAYDDPNSEPPPDPVLAPKGWTWDRTERHWRAKQRGPVLAPVPDAGDDGAAGPGGAGPGLQQRDDSGDEGAAGFEGRDPDPGWSSETRPIETFRLDAAGRADVKALVALCYTVPGEVLPLADPYCFGPLGERETATGVIDAVTDIVCASPRAAKWAVSAGGLMPWLKLAKALQPVAVGAFHHHVVHDVETKVDREARTVTVTKRDWSTQFPAA